MDNVFYFAFINSIGGVESFFNYIAKKYRDNDITIFYKAGDYYQIKNFAKNVRVCKYTGEHIKCKRLFINYNTDIIDNVEAEEYIQIIHADYSALDIQPNLHPKITKYLGVSKVVCDSFKRLTGKDIELAYNPIVIDEPKKILHLISATRLTAEKGKDRIEKLGKTLNNSGIPYIWTIFTNDTNEIDNPNIIYMKPKLNIINYIADADYLVQLSDAEGYCYAVVEALCVGTPVIVTDCPVFKELNIVDKVNSFVLDFQLSDVPVDDIYKGLKPFKYSPPKDRYDEYIVKGKSTYQEEIHTMIPVTVINQYYDLDFNTKKYPGDTFEVNSVRAKELENAGVISIGGSV